jgi:hypothetical protein
MGVGVKFGGRTSVDGEPRKKTIAVRESVKPWVEQARDLLDNPVTKDALIEHMDYLEQLAKQAND